MFRTHWHRRPPFLILLALGCGGGGSTPDAGILEDGGATADAARDGGGRDAGDPDATVTTSLAVAPLNPALRVVRGSTAEWIVEITRTGFEGAVNVTLGDLPSGITVDALSIPAASTQGTLRVSAAAEAADGGPIAITIDVEAADSGETGSVGGRLYVAGAPGTLDTSFDEDGRVEHRFTDRDYDAVRSVALDERGRLLVAGTGEAAAGNVGFVARLTPDGALDPDFGSDGVVTGFLRDRAQSTVLAVVTLGDMPLLLVYAYTGAESTTYLRQLDEEGAVDLTYGTNGDVVVPGGDRLLPRSSDLLVFDYDEMHAFDASGNAVAGFATPDVATLPNNFGGIDVASDDGLVFGGGAVDPFVIARLAPTGALDTTFGIDGSFSAPIPAGQRSSRVIDVVLAADDSGYALVSTIGARIYDAVLQVLAFEARGALDTSFGASGHLAVLGSDRALFAGDLAVQPDGRLLVGLTRTDGTAITGAAVRRFDADGDLDTGFATSGELSFGGIGPSILLDLEEAGRAYLHRAAPSGDGSFEVVRIWL